jgi:hypothetical protein
MNIVLWVLQILLAVFIALHGWMFLSPPAELVDIMNASIAPWFRMFIGAAEVLAAAGLVLPGATRILPWLTPLAAVGLMIVTASASVLHTTRGEFSSAGTTALLFVLLTFVAYMRARVWPIASRQQLAEARQSV